MRFDQVAAQRLVSLLPPLLVMDAWADDEDGWLQSTLRFLAREAKELRPGGETMITRLADILVIQMIRHWMDHGEASGEGWLAALRDPQVGRALVAMHSHPERDWSVAGLARQAAMSRSAFSARFSEMVGEPAMRYLTHHRMQLARTRLMTGDDSLGTLARDLGYGSEAAFSRAFKREFGAAPGSLRTEPKSDLT